MAFKHYIITRFNVNINPVDYEFRLRDTWLAERFELFHTYCFPSVYHQESQDFTWLVLFDEKTPDLFRRIIGSYEKYRNFVLLFCGAYDTVMARVREHIAADLAADPGGADYCLTTRLDNDDALSSRFVRALHKVAEGVLASPEPVSELYINFTHGLQYCEGTLYDFEDATNAFVSLLEGAKSPQTVFWVDHPAIYTKAPVAQIETRPIFLQTIHGRNVYNYIRGTPAKDEVILAEFHLNL